VDVGQSEIATGVTVRKAFVIDSEEMKDRGVHVMHVDFVDDSVLAELIGLAIGDPRSDAAT
jgi:hypothetical protein